MSIELNSDVAAVNLINVINNGGRGDQRYRLKVVEVGNMSDLGDDFVKTYKVTFAGTTFYVNELGNDDGYEVLTSTCDYAIEPTTGTMIRKVDLLAAVNWIVVSVMTEIDRRDNGDE